MNETSLTGTDRDPLSFGISYVDWDELTCTKQMKSAYYLKDDDDYSDLLEDQETYLSNQ